MSSRRVSLPVALHHRYIPVEVASPCRLSPPAPRSPRRSLPSTPKGTRRSLPGTPGSPYTPREMSPRSRLPDVDEDLPSISRYHQQSLRDSGFMDSMHSNNKDEEACKDGQIRSFGCKRGHITDNGYKARPVVKCINNRDTRRATCPEIWLFPDVARPSKKVVLRIYGSGNCGKKTLSHQIHQFISTTKDEGNGFVSYENIKEGARHIDFMVNNEEIQMEILLESALETSPFDPHLTMYFVVFNVDSRESFQQATQLLNRISSTSRSPLSPAVVLVANKIDLKRNQVVTSLEGKSLAKVYKCSYVEVSALLAMNIESLWRETVIRMKVPQEVNECSLLDKVVERGRLIAKSCEEIVHKLITA